MPERVVRRRVSFIRIVGVCAAVALAAIAVASYRGVPVLARLKDEVWLLKSKYSNDRSSVDGTRVAEASVSPDWATSDLAYLESEKEWLLQSQMPNGAIAQTPQQDLVVPYFANLAAKTLVDIEPQRAKNYISWYLTNMNNPDRNGLAGTIYDYVKRDGQLVPTYRYDSADSYAATFLSLVSYYFNSTRDVEFVELNLDSIDLAAKAILKLQDTDGLVRVMPGSRTKYLMDNSECYRGLLDWAGVLRFFGEDKLASQYEDAAERVSQGIDEVLYDAEKESYAWSLSWLGKRFPRQGKWYPDAVSQTDLILCGLLEPESEKAAGIWAKFNEQFPLWDQGITGDRFPGPRSRSQPRSWKIQSGLRGLSRGLETSSPEAEGLWYVMESAGTIDAATLVLKKLP